MSSISDDSDLIVEGHQSYLFVRLVLFQALDLVLDRSLHTLESGDVCAVPVIESELV